MTLSLPRPSDAARALLVRRVRAVFNDAARGETPVLPSPDALFAEGTPIRQVHGDVVAMMVGGMSALLLQMLHPAALQGVLDHSDFRHDMAGRLRRTARFIARTTYGPREEAEQAIARVNLIHQRIQGTLPDGRPYSATQPRVLAWVHLAEATSFLAAYRRYADPEMSGAAQDSYFAQFAEVARRLGADPVPESRAEAAALLTEMRGDLVGSEQAREVARFVLQGSRRTVGGAVQKLLGTAAIDLLPPFAAPMLGFSSGKARRLPALAATQAMAETVRWAFAGVHRAGT
ncbi:oxygenase MpaB family protein [Novosphingobium sp. 9]|uniref:oxygenase MpaB family protein n=1 Tax=Novosphingobium sp. 9 TaxID=2025349 RepID=UPI0021B56E4B|nr:oxygenase MpaB family protein [Novosphingobium sp. 9]